jgi:hypothetical protein
MVLVEVVVVVVVVVIVVTHARTHARTHAPGLDRRLALAGGEQLGDRDAALVLVLGVQPALAHVLYARHHRLQRLHADVCEHELDDAEVPVVVRVRAEELGVRLVGEVFVAQ